MNTVAEKREVSARSKGDDVSYSRDPGEARQWLSARYASHVLQCDSRSTQFELIHATVPIKHGTANLLQYGSAVKIKPDAFPDFYILEMPLTGSADISRKSGGSRSSAPDRALFIPPNTSFASRWRERTRQFMLQLNARDVQSRWRMLVRDETSQLPPVMPVIDFGCDEGWRVQQAM